MNEETRLVFDQIKRELTVIHYRWTLYLQIFGTNPDRINIANRTASNVFAELQWLLIDYMVLALSKLTDPASMRRIGNLSFAYLIDSIRSQGASELASELEGMLKELCGKCEEFRQIRNKRIAHNDLVVALDDGTSPLPGVSREQVEQVLESARAIANKVELFFRESQTIYQDVIIPLTNDGRALLIWLQKGLAYKALEDAQAIPYGKWREIADIDA
jgi:hypothetical protein